VSVAGKAPARQDEIRRPGWRRSSGGDFGAYVIDAVDGQNCPAGDSCLYGVAARRFGLDGHTPEPPRPALSAEAVIGRILPARMADPTTDFYAANLANW
jgi:hypothetical protein